MASAQQAKTPAGIIKAGTLVEIEKDNNRRNLAVVQKPDGKKNWTVVDQVSQQLWSQYFCRFYPPKMDLFSSEWKQCFH